MNDNQVQDQQPINLDAIQAWLVNHIASVLAVEPTSIDTHTPFIDFGLSSVDAVLISGDLEEWLGRRLSPTLLYDYPTIDSLAVFLSGEVTGDALRNLTPAEQVALSAGYTGSTAAPLSVDQVADLTDEEVERLLLEKLNIISQSS